MRDDVNSDVINNLKQGNLVFGLVVHFTPGIPQGLIALLVVVGDLGKEVVMGTRGQSSSTK